ncbi:hypothetical protein PanWU01x14_000280, partial [Parasponia andersonii]
MESGSNNPLVNLDIEGEKQSKEANGTELNGSAPLPTLLSQAELESPTNTSMKEVPRKKNQSI